MKESLRRIDRVRFELPAAGSMNVPVRLFANDRILPTIDDQTLQQAKNVASMPGIVGNMLLMADCHLGYGMPVGGVAGFDVNEGVISPSAVGYDINCLPGETRILTRFGYSLPIAAFKEKIETEQLICFWENEKTKTPIIRFFERPEKEVLYQITTESGKQIRATKDHPILTKQGMKECEKLGLELVATFSFEGIPFEPPSSRIIISEEDFAKSYPYHGKALEYALRFLKKQNLLPLTEDNPKFPLLVKIAGFIQGDGSLHFLKKHGATVGFYGEKEDLKEIKKDLKEIGFSSVLYSRTRVHKIKTMYDTFSFVREETSLNCPSRSFAGLLAALGCTTGNKAKKIYGLPSWLQTCPKWMKRLYLAALFGAELSSPDTVTDAPYNFYGPVLSMNKRIAAMEGGRIFLEEVKQLLKEFGIESTLINEREELINEKGEISIRLRLQISSVPENLEKLWEKIGFEYNKQKQFLAAVATSYLQIKQKMLAERTQSIATARMLKNEGLTLQEITQRIGNPYINERFVARSIWENRKTNVRTATKFETFDGFLQVRTEGLDQSGQVWEKIIKIEQLPFEGNVYDFTVENEAHNFVANSITVSNCGMRLMTTNLSIKDVQPKLKTLVSELFKSVPVGVGRKGLLTLSENDFDEVMVHGAKWLVKNGFGWKKDLDAIEENGAIKGADPAKVSQKARQRGTDQLGTLGSGNHYLEVQVSRARDVDDPKIAKKFGISSPDQVMVMIHCGSRGFGHQVCSDYATEFVSTMKKFDISVADRDLACVPFQSEPGQDYFAGMNCAANNAFANRQLIMHRVREVFSKVFESSAEDLEMNLVYDVCHNIAKVEPYKFDGKTRKVVVHRKGATRCFGPGQPGLSDRFQKTGQPVIVGGSMETGSYVCVGTQQAMDESLGSTMHGSGRTMSRQKAKELYRGNELLASMESRGIIVKAASMQGLAEEAGAAYKNISDVVDTMHEAGISKKVCRLAPIGNIKG